jgi:hypothetical protein
MGQQIFILHLNSQGFDRLLHEKKECQSSVCLSVILSLFYSEKMLLLLLCVFLKGVISFLYFFHFFFAYIRFSFSLSSLLLGSR